MTNISDKRNDHRRSMDDSAFAAVERVIQASEELRFELEEREKAGRALLELISTGLTFSEAIAAQGDSPSELREKASAPMDVYLESRRDLRMTLIEACLASGLSRGQIGEMMGVSRQRITALAKDLGAYTRSEQAGRRISA